MSLVRSVIRWLGTLTAAMLVSFMAGAMLCFMLGIAFNADLELLGALALFSFATLATTVVLGLIAIATRRPRFLDIAALAVVAVAALLLLAVTGADAIARREFAVLTRNLPILVETLLPIAAMVLIQWWFVRRRWRRENPA